MTLAQAMEVARLAIDKYGADADKPSVHLANALLALEPLVKAARDWRAHGEWRDFMGGPHFIACGPHRIEDALAKTIDTLDAEGGESKS